MRLIFNTLFLLIGTFGFTQAVDYNTKGGYSVEGYDVVSYFQGQPVEGKREFTTTYDGTKFKFASKAHLETFQGDPKAYLPQYGGYCAYAVAINGKKVSVDPLTYEIREDKLYLFYNKGKNNTLEFWRNESPNELVSRADKNWERIKN